VTAPEELHVVVLDETLDGARLVAVLDRAWLASALSELESCGVSADRAIVESALIGDHRGAWTVVWSGNGGFVTFGGVEAVTIDAPVDGQTPFALKLAVDESRARDRSPRQVRVLLADGVVPPDIARWRECCACRSMSPVMDRVRCPHYCVSGSAFACAGEPLDWRRVAGAAPAGSDPRRRNPRRARSPDNR
jgi:hypothetical protein